MQSDLSFEQDLSGLTRAELFVLARRVQARLHESENEGGEDNVAPPDKLAPQATPTASSLPQLEEEFERMERPQTWIWRSDAQHRLTQLTRVHSDWEDRAGLGKTRWEIMGVDPEVDPQWRKHLEDLKARRS